ncbi:MAG: DUF1517 domain-containing protein [Kovacikia sp.]
MAEDQEEIDSYELTNNNITISKLQVALRTGAHALQSKLDQLTRNADTQMQEGLFALLQQTATLLLDKSEFWTHVLARSQTLDSREAAEDLFYELLMQERARSIVKLSMNERTPDQSSPEQFRSNRNSDYIVVTLLLSTADNQPLFDEIYSASLLRDVLQEITMMRSRYLMVFELLWVPQAANDTLTDREMQSAYREMVAIG